MRERRLSNENFTRNVVTKVQHEKPHWISSWGKEAFSMPTLFKKRFCERQPEKAHWIGQWGKEALECKRCEKISYPIVWNKQCSSITPRGWWHGEKICISHHTSVKITLTFCTYLYTAKLGQDVCCLKPIITMFWQKTNIQCILGGFN